MIFVENVNSILSIKIISFAIFIRPSMKYLFGSFVQLFCTYINCFRHLKFQLIYLTRKIVKFTLSRLQQPNHMWHSPTSYIIQITWKSEGSFFLFCFWKGPTREKDAFSLSLDFFIFFTTASVIHAYFLYSLFNILLRKNWKINDFSGSFFKIHWFYRIDFFDNLLSFLFFQKHFNSYILWHARTIWTTTLMASNERNKHKTETTSISRD